MDITHLSHREVNSDKKVTLCNTQSSAYSSKTTTPKPESSLFECVHRFCYFHIFFFFKKNFKNLNRKMLKLLSKKSSFFQNTGCMELHNISHWYVCNVHGKDKWLDFPGSQTPPTAKGICSLQSKVTSSSLCTYQNEGGLSTEIERGCSQTELLVLNSSVAKLDLHYF